MSHITRGRKDDDTGFCVSNTKEDLFYCKNCKIDFALDSEKIKNVKYIVCPICIRNLTAHQKNWG